MALNISLRRLVERFYSPTRPTPGSRNGCTIPLLGLDGCGKSKLLRHLKPEGPVQTIPTMGIYLETAIVEMPSITERPLNIRSWNVGGCGTRLPPAFIAHYTQTAGSDALIWVVDSTDRTRLAESVHEFHLVVELVSYPTMKAQAIPVLILATKQDLPCAMTPREIQTSFASATSGLSSFVVGITTFNETVAQGALLRAFRWLLESVEHARAGRPHPPSPNDDPPCPTALQVEVLLEAWLARVEADCSAARFLLQFANATLPAWDHYTRIRAIYCILAGSGRQKGRDLILNGLQKHCTLRDSDAFHVTLTYFWIQVVHFCICDMPPGPMLEAQFPCASDNVDGEREPPDAGFILFLRLNPLVVDEELWLEYYSRDVMMSTKAIAKMVLPDRRRLPNIVGREVISSSLKCRAQTRIEH
ncbi:ADP-ribosylation factor [Mycena belliarum]|uniref:ADP-ribosylation factor n=1 Tax=Mycena belliarum TaxID=1033014 RepID=A0AAD6U0B7_9AGAR|nr:ADP-ribosylation factor [Mycena belliae]